MQISMGVPAQTDVFYGHGVEVSLSAKDDFLKVKETLTRIGMADANRCRLYQTCHILHKKGRYAILHFKEMFMLDGRFSSFSDYDRQRRDAIANMLHKWGLVTIITPNKISSQDKTASLKIIPFADRKKWELIPKYDIGNCVTKIRK